MYRKIFEKYMKFLFDDTESVNKTEYSEMYINLIS